MNVKIKQKKKDNNANNEITIILSDKENIKILDEWKRFINKVFPKITPSENVVYSRLFWLSIGQGKKECDVSYGDLRYLCNIKADTTLQKNIDKLKKLRFIKIIQRGFHIKTRYRVYSPLEILTPDKNDNEEVKKIQKEGAKKNVKTQTQ